MKWKIVFKEEWKQVVINEEQWDYEVSNMGRIRNSKTGRLRKLRDNKKGYLHVCLHKNRKLKWMTIHKLVGLMFIENDDPVNKTQLNHINEIRTDNRAENLQWVTPKQNCNHGTRNKRISMSRKNKKQQ